MLGGTEKQAQDLSNTFPTARSYKGGGPFTSLWNPSDVVDCYKSTSHVFITPQRTHQATWGNNSPLAGRLRNEQHWAQRGGLDTCNCGGETERRFQNWNRWVTTYLFFPTPRFSAICFRGMIFFYFLTSPISYCHRCWQLIHFYFMVGPTQEERECVSRSRAPVKTYAKCKQCLSLPLSLVTRAHYCAVFIRVEMICANKERHPSSALHCAFSSQNCKWAQPPHLVPAGSVPVPPIRALLTAGYPTQNWEGYWLRMTSDRHIRLVFYSCTAAFYCLPVWSPAKVTMWRWALSGM